MKEIVLRIGLLASVGRHFDAFWIEIVNGFRARGHEVFLAAGDEASVLHVEVLPSLTRRPSAQSVRAIKQLSAWSKNNELDIIVTNTAVCSALVRIAKIDVPIVYFAHGFHWPSVDDFSSLPWRLIERVLVPRTSGFIVLNKDDWDWVSSFAPHADVMRLPYGIGLPLDKYPPRTTGGHDRVIWVGEFSDRKRPLRAIDVFSRLSSTHPDLRLDMLGTGALLDDARRYARELGVGDLVDMPGRVDPNPYYRSGSVLLHTATWEGLPRVVLEALSVGLPVVGPPVKGIQGVEGVHVAPRDTVASLESALAEVIDQPDDFIVQVDRSMLNVHRVSQLLCDFLEEVAYEV